MRDVYSTTAYEYPGLTLCGGEEDCVYREGRSVWAQVTASRHRLDYWVINSSIHPTTGQRITSPSQIPLIQAFAPEFIYEELGTFLRMPAPDKSLSNLTSPTETQYIDDYVHKGLEIVSEGSSVHQWMGNIYERRTIYVVAK